ncbi:RNA-binding protein 5-B-like [Dorcoceras hygrometricum]|uniref:RNA-binding protein 5-B-like n=1 Tax=Dorcoceras hygrometricum TaxID=472368 RepID=A0A2Z7CQF7_9LAMI|nr:RNA-binding protein 5-B-like [Dorcoceras hygrometricum]
MPPPHPPPPQLTPYERASVDMLAGITRLLERQSERRGRLHEEDFTERFHKQGPKEFSSVEIGVAPLPPAIAFGKAASTQSYNWYQSQGHGFDSH